MAAPFALLVDTAQSRNSSDLYSTLVGAEDWDLAASTNAYLDGISGTLMAQPACLGSGWVGNNSGVNQKFGRSDFALTPSMDWQDNALATGDGPFMKYQAQNSSGVSGVTNLALPLNQAVFVEYFHSSNTSNPDGCLQGGWNSTASGASGVSFRLFQDGQFQLWKDGDQVGQYSLNGKSVDYGQTDQVIPGQDAQQYVGVMLIPGRQRELIVISTQGGGFCHIFEDIDEGTSNATITAATNFWFYVPTGCEANLRISPLQFIGGTGVGKKSFWKSDPGTTSISGTYVFYDQSSGSTATASAVDGVNPASPYSNFSNGVRVAVALNTGLNSGNYATTPFVYGARVWINQQTEPTTGDGFDLTPYVEGGAGLTLDVPDQWNGVEGQVTLMNPDAIQAAGASGDLAQQIAVTCYRPVQVWADGTQLLEGVMLQPEFIEASGLGGTDNDPTNRQNSERVVAHIRDLGQLASDYLFDEPIPLDGMPLDEAYDLVCTAIGVSSEVSSSFNSFHLPDAGNPTASQEYNFLIQPGDKGEDILDRLHKTFAGNAFHGIRGDGTFQLLDSSDLPSTPSVTLYDDIETAYGALGDWTKAQMAVFRGYALRQLEPEANVVYVTGQDFRSKRPIVTVQADTNSCNPATPSGARPPNWLGFRRKFGWIDPSITTLGLAQTVCGLLFQRLTQQRQVVEFECELSSQLFKGDLVTLSFKNGEPVTCRIKSYSTTFAHTDGSFGIWRPTRYVAQIGTDISPLHTRGTTVQDISREWRLRAQSKQLKWVPDGLYSSVWSRPIITAG